MALAERCDDAPLRLNAMRLLADALARHGDLAAGEAMARKGLDEARALRLTDPESRFLNVLSRIAAQRNDTMMLLTTSQQATALRRALGDRRNEAIGLATLGAGWLDLGHFAQARSDLDEGLRLVRAIGDRVMEPLCFANLSQLALWEGDAGLAREHATTALEIAADINAGEFELFALWCLGNAELALERLDAASMAYARALEMAHARSSPQEHDASAGLACVALARGDAAAAAQAAASVLTVLDAGGNLDGTFGATTIRLVCWQVLDRSADPRADALLTAAHDALQAQAAALPDPTLRDGFLNRVPPHRAIVSAWAAARSASGRA